MDFTGTGRRMTVEGISRAANIIGCDIAAMRAVIEVESAGRGFDGNRRPKILFEPHRFFANLSGEKRRRAVAQGLAYARWGAKPYPKTSDGQYQRLSLAMAIDETAALKSASWGLGQIMGENFAAAGFASVQAMIDAFKQSEDEQLAGMAQFVMNKDLAVHLAAMQPTMNYGQVLPHARRFARGYNGSGYRKNRYDVKIARSFLQHVRSDAVGIVGVTTDENDEDRIRFAQERLRTLGYFEVGKIDGILGSRTRGALLAFKADQNLPLTPEMDEATIVALGTGKARAVDAERATATVDDVATHSVTAASARQGKLASAIAGIWSALIAAFWGVLDFFGDASEKLTPLRDLMSDVSPWIWFAGGAGIAFILWKSHARVEERVVDDYRAGKKP